MVTQENAWFSEFNCLLFSVTVCQSELLLRSPERFRCWQEVEVEIVEDDVFSVWIPTGEVEHVAVVHMSTKRSSPFCFPQSSRPDEKQGFRTVVLRKKKKVDVNAYEYTGGRYR